MLRAAQIDNRKATIVAIAAILFLIGLITSACTKETPPQPPIDVRLATMEKEFNDNPADAMNRYSGRPLRVRARVSSIDEDQVKLETIYLLTVTAELASPPLGVVRGDAILDCGAVESVSIGGGYKPKLINCAVEPQDRKAIAATEAAAASREEIKHAESVRSGDACRGAWDSSSSMFSSVVKAGLRDPDSFGHIRTFIRPTGADGRNYVKMVFRARNALGGMMISEAIGSIDPKTCEATLDHVKVLE